jgi:polar amino acid transport system substrate-binding protein
MSSVRLCLFVLTCGVLLSPACTNLPRDPKSTLQEIQRRPVRVGLLENAPWVVRVGSEPAGAEVELIREFAAQLGTTPEWHWGGEDEQFEALEHYGLDLVIGGLSSRTPWKSKIGLTSPYFSETIRVGSRESQTVDSLKGMTIVVLNQQTAVLVVAKGAKAIRVNHHTEMTGLVAGPDWQLQQLNVSQSHMKLDSMKHVIAVPPGENALIKRLDEFLYSKRDNLLGLLQQHVSRYENPR